jgi:hypothetical protein
VVGASRSPAGFGGYFYNTNGGTALLASSANGVAIRADGVINSTAPTYLWISGSGIQPYQSTDSTVITMDTIGGALVERGVTGGSKYVMLPVTIPGVLYGQNVTISAIDIYWVGETEFDSLSNIRVRLQTGGVCPSCYDDLLYDSTTQVCDLSNHPTGCVAHYDLTTNNVLGPAAGVIHIGFGLSFSGSSTYVDIGGVRLTLEYDN